MKLKYFSFSLFIGTILSLAYTSQQVEIIKLAYQGGRANKAYKELLDRQHYLRYNLLNLKSSAYLGNKLLDENTSFEIPKESQILSLAVPRENMHTGQYEAHKSLDSKSNVTKDTLFVSFSKIQESWPVSLVKSLVNNHAQAQDIKNK